MEPDEEFVNILFKIVRQCNKTQYNTFTVKDAPIFVTVKELREFLFKKFGVELAPAATAESFRLGCIAGTNRRISISNSTQLAEAYSLEKRDSLLFGQTQISKRKVRARLSSEHIPECQHWSVKMTRVYRMLVSYVL